MLHIKKSLRAKITLVLFFVGVVPLASASVFFYFTAKDALFKNVFKELKWNANEISDIMESHFNEAAKDLLTASQNAAFKMYFTDPENRGFWLAEQQKNLRYLRELYPDVIDESCFIDDTGHEIARIVFDKIAGQDELSSEEERSFFFKEAFSMEEGEVYQGVPMLSEDTKRWVVPNATPILVNGKKAAILHFEVTMTHFQRLLKRAVNPDRGFAFILNDKGEFMAHTRMELSETGPFPPAITPETPPILRGIYKRMMAGESGIEQFFAGDKSYYIIFQPVRAGYFKGRNDNGWSIAYAISADRVYVEVSILRYELLSVAFTLSIVIILAYVIGNYVTKPIRELADASDRVAEGELPKLDVRRSDEIGHLSKAFNMMVDAVKKRDEELKALAITDGLTGLYNHRYFKAELEKATKSAMRFNRRLSLIMADVDYFKHYNDSHGHQQGDLAIKRVAGVFLKNTREVDIAARYGGEEFAVILPETALAEALSIAERIRRKVEEEVIPYEEMQPNGDLTVSIGVASIKPEGGAWDAESLIDAADKALYAAKELGRNRVCQEAKGKQDEG